MINLGYLRFRILVIFFIAIFFFLFIVGRALQLQVVPNQKLKELASRQYKTAVTLSAQRGTFYDRHMNELAISRKVGSIFANPKMIKNKKAAALRLSGLTGVSASKILQKLKLKKSFVWIDRLVEDSVTARLLSKPIEGVGLIYEYKRFYNNQELAGQVLGLTDIDSQGIEGVEYGYNQVLQGQKKSLVLLRDAYGRIVSLDETLFMESQEGHSLVLSLDKSLQFSVEKELESQVQKFKAKNGLAIVQNAETGEILAMAHYPFFNPNRFHPSQKGLWKNRAVIEAFEPGSTFKVILAAAALEEGTSSQDTFFCEQGFFRVNRKDAIREAQNHKYGWLSLSDILKYSSNICAAKVALQIGKEPFYRKIVEFGFGS
ncbi:MAG: penicillin-binding protein 2, partial [Deltaproteobacteria bacterium]|nr:penicillin-binding protein 2 [Deltaproteobacteria bacterium]